MIYQIMMEVYADPERFLKLFILLCFHLLKSYA